MATSHRPTARVALRPSGSPLGPGGRPWSRLRTLSTTLAALVIASNTVLMLADRAPKVLRGAAKRLDTNAPRAAARVASEARAHSSDTLVHVTVWALAATLVGLAAWSWGSALLAGAGTLGYSLLVEAAQPLLSTSRQVQSQDVLANLAGVALGLAATAAFTGAWHLIRARP